VVVEQRPPLCRTLLPLHRLFQEFRRDLEDHLDKQDALFPALLDLEIALRASEQSVMAEDDVYEALRLLKYGQIAIAGVLNEMRELTDNFPAPPGACKCYGELLDVLAGIQMAVDSEVRMERTMLFPQADELLERVQQSAARERAERPCQLHIE
jgi:iron-sulfur cluster repair protein YtfE (RIC family)